MENLYDPIMSPVTVIRDTQAEIEPVKRSLHRARKVNGTSDTNAPNVEAMGYLQRGQVSFGPGGIGKHGAYSMAFAVQGVGDGVQPLSTGGVIDATLESATDFTLPDGTAGPVNGQTGIVIEGTDPDHDRKIFFPLTLVAHHRPRNAPNSSTLVYDVDGDRQGIRGKLSTAFYLSRTPATVDPTQRTIITMNAVSLGKRGSDPVSQRQGYGSFTLWDKESRYAGSDIPRVTSYGAEMEGGPFYSGKGAQDKHSHGDDDEGVPHLPLMFSGLDTKFGPGATGMPAAPFDFTEELAGPGGAWPYPTSCRIVYDPNRKHRSYKGGNKVEIDGIWHIITSVPFDKPREGKPPAIPQYDYNPPAWPDPEGGKGKGKGAWRAGGPAWGPAGGGVGNPGAGGAGGNPGAGAGGAGGNPGGAGGGGASGGDTDWTGDYGEAPTPAIAASPAFSKPSQDENCKPPICGPGGQPSGQNGGAGAKPESDESRRDRIARGISADDLQKLRNRIEAAKSAARDAAARGQTAQAEEFDRQARSMQDLADRATALARKDAEERRAKRDAAKQKRADKKKAEKKDKTDAVNKKRDEAKRRAEKNKEAWRDWWRKNLAARFRVDRMPIFPWGATGNPASAFDTIRFGFQGGDRNQANAAADQRVANDNVNASIVNALPANQYAACNPCAKDVLAAISQVYAPAEDICPASTHMAMGMPSIVARLPDPDYERQNNTLYRTTLTHEDRRKVDEAPIASAQLTAFGDVGVGAPLASNRAVNIVAGGYVLHGADVAVADIYDCDVESALTPYLAIRKEGILGFGCVSRAGEVVDGFRISFDQGSGTLTFQGVDDDGANDNTKIISLPGVVTVGSIGWGNGTQAAPGGYFSTNTDNGVFLIADDHWALAAGGAVAGSEPALQMQKFSGLNSPHLSIGTGTPGRANLFEAEETLGAVADTGASPIVFKLTFTASDASGAYTNLQALNLNPTLAGSTCATMLGGNISNVITSGTVTSEVSGYRVTTAISGGTFTGAVVVNGVRSVQSAVTVSTVPYWTGGYSAEGTTSGAGAITFNVGHTIRGHLMMESNANNEILWGTGSGAFKTTVDVGLTRFAAGQAGITTGAGTGTKGAFTCAGLTTNSITPNANNSYNLGSVAANWVLINMAVGSVGNPSYTFGTDQNTGIYQGGADVLGLAAGGQSVLITEAGSIIHVSSATGRLTLGTSTLISAGTAGDLACGLTGAAQLFYDQSATTLNTYDASAVLRFEMNASNGTLSLYHSGGGARAIIDAQTGYARFGGTSDAVAQGDFGTGIAAAARLFYDQSAAALYLYNSSGTVKAQWDVPNKTESFDTWFRYVDKVSATGTTGFAATTIHGQAGLSTGSELTVTITGHRVDSGSYCDRYTVLVRTSSAGVTTQANSILDSTTEGTITAPTVTFSISGTNLQCALNPNDAVNTITWKVQVEGYGI